MSDGPALARLLLPAEVQEILGVSRAWVYTAANDGRLPCVRLGGPGAPVRFRPEDIQRFIDQHTTGTRRNAS